MASSTTNPSAPSLAAMLSVRRKMAARNTAGSDPMQTPPSRPAVANAHSNERIVYHQDTTALNPPQITPTTVPENATDQPKISRKTKQLEVGLLDMKMEEINRKQTEKTNAALDSWKGFDSVNYGFYSTPGAANATPAPPPITKQRTHTPPPPKQTSPDKQPSPTKEHPPTEESVPARQPPTAQQQSPAEESAPAKQQSPIKQLSSVRQKSPVRQQSKAEEPAPVKQQSPKREPSPKQTDSPVKHQPKSKPPPPSPEKGNPSPQKTVEKEPSPPPSPKKQPVVERRSLSSPPPPLLEEKPLDKQSSRPPIILSQRSRVKSPEQERPRSVPPKSPTPVIEHIIPISAITSDPQIFQKNTQPHEKLSIPTPNNHHFKPFPDIKNYEVRKSRHALKSIQRSMDRYRFHVW